MSHSQEIQDPESYEYPRRHIMPSLARYSQIVPLLGLLARRTDVSLGLGELWQHGLFLQTRVTLVDVINTRSIILDVQ
jgi:hypothetical protein